jgi:hypothetical protein
MSMKIKRLKGWRRDEEKKISRELDSYVLAEGLQSSTEVAIKKDFFAALNLSDFKILAIGGRNLECDE